MGVMNNDFVKYLKLPFHFDSDKLKNDLKFLLEDRWIDHYNSEAYEGDWKSISLYSVDGKEDSIFAEQSIKKELKPTPLMAKSRYLKEVVDTFQFPLLGVRLLKLSVGAVIKPHKDFRLGYEDGDFRLHIPILTNAKVNFKLGGERIDMQEGECWYTNVNYTHSVSNEGSIDRVHLIIDGQRNDWSDDLFFALAPKERLVYNTDELLIAEYEGIIRELELSSDPTSQRILSETKLKLKELKLNVGT